MDKVEDRTKTLVEAFQQQELVNLIGDRTGYGRFRIIGLTLARQKHDGNVERLFPAPAHLLEVKGEDNQKQLVRLKPTLREEKGVHTDLPDGMQLLYADKTVEEEGKLEPMEGWLTEQGLLKILRTKEDLTKEERVSNRKIFEYEARLGIGYE